MSRRYRDQNSDCKVYVGDLGNGASKQDLESAFSYYGHLKSVWIARKPPGFAFVEYEDPRDAEDSCRGLDGRLMNGHRIRVELSRGRSRRMRQQPSRGRPFNPDDRCYECGDKGHYARDCDRPGSKGGSGSGSGYRGKRSPSRSRSRSPARDSRSRSHSRSPARKNTRTSRSRSKSRSATPHSRSRSPQNGEAAAY